MLNDYFRSENLVAVTCCSLMAKKNPVTYNFLISHYKVVHFLHLQTFQEWKYSVRESPQSGSIINSNLNKSFQISSVSQNYSFTFPGHWAFKVILAKSKYLCSTTMAIYAEFTILFDQCSGSENQAFLQEYKEQGLELKFPTTSN